MKHLSKKIFKAMGKTDYEIPNYTQIEDHKEAKRVMKEYLENVMEVADERAQKEVAKAEEILESPLFIEQKGIRSLVDTDARVGYKSKTDSFFGYKMEYTLTTDGHLISAVDVHNGAYVDGTEVIRLYERNKASGLKIGLAFGDKAYFKKAILDILKTDAVKAYIPVSASSYRINEEFFSYNKDSDQWFCKQRNMTVDKKTKKTKRKGRNESTYYEYIFKKEECVECPLREECIKSVKTKAKKLIVGVSSAEYYEHSQWTKTKEFKEEYKERAAIEWKNAELKRFHGLTRAKGYGLIHVSIQAKFAALAVNLKRIARLAASILPDFFIFLKDNPQIWF
jgi:hypothetical protein